MKTYVFNVNVTVDETNKNVPSLDDIKTVIEDLINTPDNGHYGIVSVMVEAVEI